MSDFARRHYELIARVMQRTKPYGTERENAIWQAIVVSFAHVLEQDNPRFDVSGFYEACGYDPNDDDGL